MPQLAGRSAASIYGRSSSRYYTMEFPERFHAAMDTRRWRSGERIVFEPYTREVFEQSLGSIAQHEIFESGSMGLGDYQRAVISLAPN